MNEITSATLIIISTVIFVVIFVLFRLLINNISRSWKRHKAETVDKWEAEGIEFIRGPKGSKFGGLESMGVHKVIRGIGFAAITSHDLRVTRSVPSEVWLVPLTQIKNVAIQPTFLSNRSQKTPFIVISFEQDGKTEKLGFQVHSYEEWAQDLAKAAGVRWQDIRE